MILQPQWLRQIINQEFEHKYTKTDELMGFVWRYILNCFDLSICLFIYSLLEIVPGPDNEQ